MKKQERQVYRDTYELFDGCCALCGNPFIQMHHIRYGAEGRKTYIGNVIILCQRCHQLVHTNKKYWQPRLIEIDKRVRGEQ